MAKAELCKDICTRTPRLKPRSLGSLPQNQPSSTLVQCELRSPRVVRRRKLPGTRAIKVSDLGPKGIQRIGSCKEGAEALYKQVVKARSHESCRSRPAERTRGAASRILHTYQQPGCLP